MNGSVVPKIDVDALLSYFGGAQRLSEGLRRHGLTSRPVTTLYKTISKWQERDSISIRALLMLTALAKAEGRTFDIRAFLVWPRNERS